MIDPEFFRPDLLRAFLKFYLVFRFRNPFEVEIALGTAQFSVVRCIRSRSEPCLNFAAILTDCSFNYMLFFKNCFHFKLLDFQENKKTECFSWI